MSTVQGRSDAAAAIIPTICEQQGCRLMVQTFCPLCERFFCDLHDELYPRRMHDCLRGKADEE